MSKKTSVARIREIFQSRFEPRHMHTLAVTYWRTLLIVAVLSTIGILLWAFIELQASRSVLERLNEPSPNQAPILTRQEIDGMAAQLTEAQSTYLQIKNASTSVAGPAQ